MREKSRVVFVSNTDVFFLTYRLPVARAERDRGAEVVVAAPAGGLEDQIRAEGFRYVPLPLSRRGVSPRAEVQAIAALLRLYREFRPHLVHHLTIKPVLYGSLAAQLVGDIPVVNAVTGLGYVFSDSGRARLMRPLVKAMYRQVLSAPNSRTIFENADDAAEFQQFGLVPVENSCLIPGLGVNCSRFAPSPEPQGEPVVILPCRMLWDKGVAQFVEAAEILRGQGARARFVLAGCPDAGNPHSIPEWQLREWAGRGIVEWWGHMQAMPEVFARSHIVVLPTFYREGVPRVLLEAAAAGRPVVATYMPGCREIVRPGVNGLLVPPRDSAGLACAIQTLLDDGELRARFGAAGRLIATQEFSETGVIQRILDLHQGLIEDHGSTPPKKQRAGAKSQSVRALVRSLIPRLDSDAGVSGGK